MASEPRWRWTATRKRPRPATLNPELASPVVARSSWRAASRMLDGERLDDARGRDLERGGLELAVDADVGDGAGLEVQVGTPDLVQVRQELFQLGHTAYIGPRRPVL